MKRIIAIVGMAGSGKSIAARFFRDDGYPGARFGDITEDEIKKRNLNLTSGNERLVREDIRSKEGMDAYAKRIVPKADSMLENSDIVVLDGLYSWEEYKYLKKIYKDSLIILAIIASPKKRYLRLAERDIRPLTADEAKSRDFAEIENISKAGPIAMADYSIINESSEKQFESALNDFLKYIKN